MRESNCSGVMDWAPSHRAWGGSLCTSMSRPSAPAAMAAMLIRSTIHALPQAWEGSTTTGRWDSCFTASTAERSRVLRVKVSKVRMPRSQRITLLLPPAMMYSALMSHSSMVEDNPRLSRMGLEVLPSCFKRSKFCMFRAPTWITSTHISNISTLSVDMISVTMGRPVAALASWSRRMPSLPMPWKE